MSLSYGAIDEKGALKVESGYAHDNADPNHQADHRDHGRRRLPTVAMGVLTLAALMGGAAYAVSASGAAKGTASQGPLAFASSGIRAESSPLKTRARSTSRSKIASPDASLPESRGARIKR